MIYLGNAQTSNVASQDDCTPDPSAPPLPNARRVVKFTFGSSGTPQMVDFYGIRLYGDSKDNK